MIDEPQDIPLDKLPDTDAKNSAKGVPAELLPFCGESRLGPTAYVSSPDLVSPEQALLLTNLEFALSIDPVAQLDLSDYRSSLQRTTGVLLLGSQASYSGIGQIGDMAQVRDFSCLFEMPAGMDFTGLRQLHTVELAGKDAYRVLANPSVRHAVIASQAPGDGFMSNGRLHTLEVLGRRKDWTLRFLRGETQLRELVVSAVRDLDLGGVSGLTSLERVILRSVNVLQGLDDLATIQPLEYLEIDRVRQLRTPADLRKLTGLELRVVDSRPLASEEQLEIDRALRDSGGNAFFFPQKAAVPDPPIFFAKDPDDPTVIRPIVESTAGSAAAHLHVKTTVNVVTQVLWESAPVYMRRRQARVAQGSGGLMVQCSEMRVAREVARVLNLAWATARRIDRIVRTERATRDATSDNV